MQLFHRHLNYCIHIKIYIYIYIIYITNVLCKYYLYTNNIKLSVQITNKTWKIIFTNNDDEEDGLYAGRTLCVDEIQQVGAKREHRHKGRYDI